MSDGKTIQQRIGDSIEEEMKWKMNPLSRYLTIDGSLRPDLNPKLFDSPDFMETLQELEKYQKMTIGDLNSNEFPEIAKASNIYDKELYSPSRALNRKEIESPSPITVLNQRKEYLLQHLDDLIAGSE